MDLEIVKKKKRSFKDLEVGDVFTTEGWQDYYMVCGIESYVCLTGARAGHLINASNVDILIKEVKPKLVVNE